ncbi:MAG: transglycosylase SLT domain-containing protein [Oscillospiraceae bacterium]|nr:transglycosylase SLT domain-containing protein [Oscillospiraceae bacterium]
MQRELYFLKLRLKQFQLERIPRGLLSGGKRILANKITRKAMVFAVTFAVAAVSLGTAMLGSRDVVYVEESPGQAAHADSEAEPKPEPVIPKPVVSEQNTPVREYPQLSYSYTEAVFALPCELPEPEPTEEDTVPQIRHYSPPEYWAVVDEGFRYLPDIPLSEDLQRYTYMKCREIGFDYTMVLAIMWGESNFRIGAVGHNPNGTSDSGIMQINDVNREWLYRELDIDDLLNPYQNIDAGLEILRRLSEKHGQHNAVMAYQMGERGMLRFVEGGLTNSSYTERLYKKQTELELMFAALEE